MSHVTQVNTRGVMSTNITSETTVREQSVSISNTDVGKMDGAELSEGLIVNCTDVYL